MKTQFIIEGWTPLDLLNISKDDFYNQVNQEYKKQFNIDIEIKYMEFKYISKNKLKITILSIKKIKT